MQIIIADRDETTLRNALDIAKRQLRQDVKEARAVIPQLEQDERDNPDEVHRLVTSHGARMLAENMELQLVTIDRILVAIEEAS